VEAPPFARPLQTLAAAPPSACAPAIVPILQRCAVSARASRDPLPSQSCPGATGRSARRQRERSDDYYDTKSQVFAALIDTIDLSQLAKSRAAKCAREEIRDIVNDIIAIKNYAMSISEQEELLEDICNDVLGYGPLEPLLARDDIADIMVNGAKQVFIEVGGKIQQS
jgi:pilus assembly protein CpaF